jgi:hypothetical protein
MISIIIKDSTVSSKIFIRFSAIYNITYINIVLDFLSNNGYYSREMEMIFLCRININGMLAIEFHRNKHSFDLEDIN